MGTSVGQMSGGMLRLLPLRLPCATNLAANDHFPGTSVMPSRAFLYSSVLLLLRNYNSQRALVASGCQGMLGVVVLHQLEVALRRSAHSNITRDFALAN